METNEKAVSVGSENSSKKRVNNKWIVIGIILIAIIAFVIGLVNYNSFDNSISEQLDLGQKYLEEQDYEQAIVAFNKAIEIDDKCVEAYIGLADAYVGIGDTESAMRVLENGIELTGDASLKEVLEILKNEKSIVNQNVNEVVHENEDLDNVYLYETLDDMAIDIISQLGTVGEFDIVGASYDEFTRYFIDNYDVEEDKDGTHVQGWINDKHDGFISAAINTDSDSFSTVEKSLYIQDGVAWLSVNYCKDHIEFDCRLSDEPHFDDYSEPLILNFPLIYQDWDGFFSKYVPLNMSETEESWWYNDEISLNSWFDEGSKNWVFQDRNVNTLQFSYDTDAYSKYHIRIDTTGSYMNGANDISIDFQELEDSRRIYIIFSYE